MSLKFQSGGWLREGAFYVKRPADQELLDALTSGEFCYVLAPRQIGKSSLMHRTWNLLRQRGTKCARLDLSILVDASPDEYYDEIIKTVAKDIEMSQATVDAFFAQNQRRPAQYRFNSFVTDLVLAKEVGQPTLRVVFFFDEIDTLLVSGFQVNVANFLNIIRALHSFSNGDQTHHALSICLLGVASVLELTPDPMGTPFNVAKPIHLGDFTREEATAFIPGLPTRSYTPSQLLDAVMSWTDGHPYMTQFLCSELTRSRGMVGITARQHVRLIVNSKFPPGGETQDINLAPAVRRLNLSPSAELPHDALRLYCRLLGSERIPSRPNDQAQQELLLAGLAAVRPDENEDGPQWLRCRNRIVASVLNQEWVAKHSLDKLIGQPLHHWVLSTRDGHYGLRGAQLQAALDWAKSRNDLTSDEAHFLLSSMQEQNASDWSKKLTEMRDVFEVELQAAQSTNGLLREEKSRYQEEQERTRHALEQLRQEKELLQAEYDQAGHDRETLDVELQATQATCGQLRAEAAQLKEQSQRALEQLRQEKELLEAEAAQARVDSAKHAQLNGEVSRDAQLRLDNAMRHEKGVRRRLIYWLCAVAIISALGGAGSVVDQLNTRKGLEAALKQIKDVQEKLTEQRKETELQRSQLVANDKAYQESLAKCSASVVHPHSPKTPSGERSDTPFRNCKSDLKNCLEQVNDLKKELNDSTVSEIKVGLAGGSLDSCQTELNKCAMDRLSLRSKQRQK